MAYSKLHSSLINSSLWTQPDNVRLLFITMLAMCDRDGYVYGSRGGIFRAANITWDRDEENDPFQVLLDPDEDSSDLLRNPENEGRRIEEIPGGFRLLNFEYYRGLRNEDDRREQNRIAQAKHREKISHSQPASAEISHDKPRQIQKQIQKQSTDTKESINRSVDDSLFTRLVELLPAYEMTKNGGLWSKRIKESYKAMYNTLEDYQLRRDKGNIRNLPAWLTNRFMHNQKEIEKAKHESSKVNSSQ